jgi:hypothetical protein
MSFKKKYFSRMIDICSLVTDSSSLLNTVHCVQTNILGPL